MKVRSRQTGNFAPRYQKDQEDVIMSVKEDHESTDVQVIKAARQMARGKVDI